MTDPAKELIRSRINNIRSDLGWQNLQPRQMGHRGDGDPGLELAWTDVLFMAIVQACGTGFLMKREVASLKRLAERIEKVAIVDPAPDGILTFSKFMRLEVEQENFVAVLSKLSAPSIEVLAKSVHNSRRANSRDNEKYRERYSRTPDPEL